MKKITALILALIMVFSTFIMIGYADGNSATAFIANYDETEEKYSRQINWFEAGGKYYFFIPSSIDYETAKLCISGNYTVDGKSYSAPAALSEVFGEKKELALEFGGNKYDVVIINESKAPSLFISTESGSLDYIHAVKGNEEEGMIEIVDENGEIVYNGALEIKGRGNSTWQMEKKPYNIKLDKKTNLFGMGKTKKWSLIANHSDESLVRNVAAYYAAQKAGMPYTPQFTPVDVYINNDYMGAYLLTTRVGIDSSSVDIDDLEGNTEEVNDYDLDTYAKGGTYGTFAGLLAGTKKWYEIPNNPKDITGGYIIEMELANRYTDEASGFVTTRNQPFTMKTPEYASKAQMEYISDYYQRFEDAVYSETGKNAKGEHYTDIADMESLAVFYALNEWTSNQDCGLTSTYFYKPVGDKLYAGPAWDFDICFANNDSGRFGCDYTNPKEFTVCFGRQYRNTFFGKWDVDEFPHVFNVLNKKEDFVAEVKKVWDSKVKPAVELTNTMLSTYAEENMGSAVMNAIRWNIFDTYNVEDIKAAYKQAVKEVYDFSTVRSAFLTDNFGTVQVQENQTNFFLAGLKKIGAGMNDLFEKIIVAFGLENTIF